MVTGLAFACAAFAIQTLLALVNVYAADRSVAQLDLEEGGVVTWAASSATIAVGVIALILSFVDPGQRRRGPAIALGVAFLSFDDALFLHERLGFRLTEALEVADTYVQLWPTLYLPLLATVAVLIVQLTRDTPVARSLIVLGLATLVVAIGLEVAGLALDRAGVDEEDWLRTLERTLEEGLELSGWIVVATGVAARLVTLAHARTPAAEA